MVVVSIALTSGTESAGVYGYNRDAATVTAIPRPRVNDMPPNPGGLDFNSFDVITKERTTYDISLA